MTGTMKLGLAVVGFYFLSRYLADRTKGGGPGSPGVAPAPKGIRAPGANDPSVCVFY